MESWWPEPEAVSCIGSTVQKQSEMNADVQFTSAFSLVSDSGPCADATHKAGLLLNLSQNTLIDATRDAFSCLNSTKKTMQMNHHSTMVTLFVRQEEIKRDIWETVDQKACTDSKWLFKLNYCFSVAVIA